MQPHPDALQYAQDKLMMRQAVEDLGLPNPRWARVETLMSFSPLAMRSAGPWF